MTNPIQLSALLVVSLVAMPALAGDETPGAVDTSQAFDLELTAGQLSIHDGQLFHASNSNTSQRRRCGLTLRYCTPDVRAVGDFGWHHEGVLISGNDPDNYWGNPARPKEDHVITPDNLIELPTYADQR